MDNKIRQAQFRANKAAQGHYEVRGIFAPKDDHPAIKGYAEKLIKRRINGRRK